MCPAAAGRTQIAFRVLAFELKCVYKRRGGLPDALRPVAGIRFPERDDLTIFGPRSCAVADRRR